MIISPRQDARSTDLRSHKSGAAIFCCWFLVCSILPLPLCLPIPLFPVPPPLLPVPPLHLPVPPPLLPVPSFLSILPPLPLHVPPLLPIPPLHLPVPHLPSSCSSSSSSSFSSSSASSEKPMCILTTEYLFSSLHVFQAPANSLERWLSLIISHLKSSPLYDEVDSHNVFLAVSLCLNQSVCLSVCVGRGWGGVDVCVCVCVCVCVHVGWMGVCMCVHACGVYVDVCV